MSIDINDSGEATIAPAVDDYESVIRDAVRQAMLAPELIASQRTLSDAERADLIAQLRELRALLCRLLEMITRT